jgi:poly-gamma-glutamate capsule biosynthesis protein CapA/YwtB (metallophosphatase superfamily)
MKIALVGDTMLGRNLAEALTADLRAPLFDPPIAEICREADLCVLNLECCISDRGERWGDPLKPFFFRAPPVAADVLTSLGVDCVTLANNHALDFGYEALLDTFEHLRSAGIRWVGAGRDINAARAPVVLERGAERLVIIGASDHPTDFGAGPTQPGIALARLGRKISPWLLSAIGDHPSDPVLVSPHWGPNMNPAPLSHIRSAAEKLVAAGAALVAGHSAHVFHGVKPPILYDIGDFIDDYAVDPVLRNDLGLLFVATLEAGQVIQVETIPLKLDYCYTRLAVGDDAEWIRRRFASACQEVGSSVEFDQERLIVRA